MTLFLQLAAEPCARWMGLPPEAVVHYRLLLLAAGAQAVGLLGLILLFYFDLRREACLAAIGLLLGVSTLTVAALQSGLPPSVGTALGCGVGMLLTWRSVFRGVHAVLEHTLLGQPYGAEASGRPSGAVEGASARVPRPRRTGELGPDVPSAAVL